MAAGVAVYTVAALHKKFVTFTVNVSSTGVTLV
jgi:hypothetical protein